ILETVPECDINGREYCKSQIHIFDIKRADIKRLGDLKGNKFTIKLNGVREINKNTKFLNYFGAQRFGKCKNNHKIGEKILNREYEEAVEMIMKNSKGYEAYKSSESENKIKKITTVCDSTEKYIFMMKLKGKTDKNIVFGLKREIRMLYLHAYQSYLYNESINKEIEKNRQLYESGITNDVFEDHEVANVGVDSSLILPLEKMNDKMLKGGSRKAVAECIALEGKSYETHFEVSFFLGTSSYATMALRELLGKNKLNL
ncbi:Pseudouridylate synthase 7 like protein, partial [Nosema granulosis]